MTRLNLASVQADLSGLVGRIVKEGERIVVELEGADVAALVSVEDLMVLEGLQDQCDYEAAERALAEMRAAGENPIPWEEAKAELGLS